MSVSASMVASGLDTRERLRLRLCLRGVVQGLGFRPHVYRLAIETRVSGWVCNSQAGVVIEVEGTKESLARFRRRLEEEQPPGSSIHALEAVGLEPKGCEGFQIRPSDQTGERSVVVRPDVATCEACLQEIFDPHNRRYGYPFTNCTHCGPRYSIIEALPYDRPNTSMKRFTMCPECRAEYENPADRRFHAQPNACPNCGPELELWSADGDVVMMGAEALQAGIEAIRRGQILAVKGLGGFHLMTDARSEPAVRLLRMRKHREEKPLAVMLPGIEQARALCHLSSLEEGLLRSPESPIVLLRRRVDGRQQEGLADSVAPGNPYLGVMMPYTPLHHLLMAALQFPVVATSGNLGDEPICIDEDEARERLHGIADGFLVHNRPIVRQVDDSVIGVVAGREMMIRRARGYAPLPVTLRGYGGEAETDRLASGDGTGAEFGKGCVLAVGGHLKNSVALTSGSTIVLGQHIGDLDTTAALSAFQRVIHDLQGLFKLEPKCVVSDLHPDYASTREAKKRPQRQLGVQHHFAHILACMAENEVEEPALGIAWDGTGYGTDGVIWGGEFLIAERGGYDRFATMRPFRLPGSERAIREPRRSAVGLLFEHYGRSAFQLRGVSALSAFTSAELKALRQALERPFNAPHTTAVGRLFDAVASLLGIRQRTGFEGQAAMALEWLAVDRTDEPPYNFQLRPAESSRDQIAAESRVGARDAIWQADWGSMIEALLRDLHAGMAPARMATRFHRGLVELMVVVAARAGLERVALSGGCFQNRVLLEGAIERLRAAGHRVYWHQRVPTNDGGLALGQAVAGLRAEVERMHQ